MPTSIINTKWQFATELWVYNMTQLVSGESVLTGASAPTLTITTPDGYVLTYSADTIDVFSANSVINMDASDQGKPFVINQYYVGDELSSGIMVDSDGNAVTTMPWTEFPDGTYKIQFSFTSSVGAYEEVTEYALLTFTIRNCIATRVKIALDAMCKGCHTDADKDLCLMLALLRAIELNFEKGYFTDAATALTRLQNICNAGNYCCG